LWGRTRIVGGPTPYEDFIWSGVRGGRGRSDGESAGDLSDGGEHAGRGGASKREDTGRGSDPQARTGRWRHGEREDQRA